MSSISDEEPTCSVDSLMVRLNSGGHEEDTTRESRQDYGCYICGALNPNWHVYAKPPNNSTKNPFFPFLEYHQPTASARPIERESGKVDVCTVCFSFLTQQWRAFEEKETPIVKRIYWLKRPGSEYFEGFDKESDRGYDSQEGLVNNNMNKDVTMNERHHSKVKSKSQSTTAEEKASEARLFTEEQHSKEASTESCSSSQAFGSSLSLNVNSVNKKTASLEFCFVCSRQKPKEFMRSVHTRPQLKTETPFYPCLTKHNPAILAKKMDFLGKVLVCEACQKFLFRQWQVFQKNNTPLCERQYQLRSDPSLPRDQQSQLSTMVCFICGVTQPATSGRFLYSRKHAPGDPYYPFLNKLKPPPGAMPLTKHGLTRACSGCRKSLHRQWKEFEARFIAEDDREYRIRNDGITVSLSSPTSSLTPSLSQTVANQESSPLALTTTVDNTLSNESRLMCYTCGEPCDESSMRPIYTRQNTNPLKGNFCFPFIALLEAPPGSRPLDSIGRTLACKKCYKFLQVKWEQFERELVPPQMRIYAVDGKANIRLKCKSYVCYLCGIKCNSTHMNFKLHSYPHNGEGVQDGGSFFPFLASREPKPNAEPISSEGTVLACEICFSNLMVQWKDYENSLLPEESNRWLRKYQVDHIICYFCGKPTQRENCSSVSKLLVTFQTRHKIHKGSLFTNRKQEIVLCDGCQREAQQEFESTKEHTKRPFPGLSTLRESDNTTQDQTKRAARSHLIPIAKKPVIVIESSDSEDDSSPLLAKHSSRYSRSRHANASPMHYTPSASPGVPQPTLPIKDYHPSGSPSASMQPSNSGSFAAALRKLAKQAMPIGTSSSAASSCSGSQPASPTISHASSRSAGVSPSRSSPATTQTPPPPRGDGAISKERQPLVADRELQSIATPPMPPIPALESDNINPNTSESNRVPSLGPHRLGSREQPESSSHSKGHEVLPGVFSTKPRYQSESSMISEHGYPTEHGHPVVPYYLHSGRSDVPLFIPRGTPLPGPPPLLASKRENADPHAVSPFFQGVYPPTIMDSPDIHFETWRQQRAVEHLRQQHERQERPMVSISGHSDLASPKDNTSDKDKGKEGGSSEPHDHISSAHRMYYSYNESKPPSCPVHGHSPGETHHGQHKHNPGRTDQIPTSKPDRPEEFNRLFLPPHPDGPAMLHPYIVHPHRDGPFGPQHLGERQAEMFKERDRQEMMMHQRMVIDQREHIKAREEEWQRRQQRLRQEKEEHQREMAHYRHQVLQQQREMEQPRREGDQPGVDHRRPDYRQTDHRERSDKSPHTNDRPSSGHTHEPDVFRHYPFHPAFHPLPHDIRARLPFPDLQRKDGEMHRNRMEALRDGRNPQPHPFGFHDPHLRPFSDQYPFHQDRLTSGGDRLFTEARWPAHTRPTYMNGDLRTVDIHSSGMVNKLPEELSARIKKESLVDLTGQQVVKTKQHDKEKLKFLEGLGLVTLAKKKELTHGDPSIKRKFEGQQETPPPQDDKASTESSGTREETEETSSEGTTDVESGTTSTDTEISPKQYKEKINFMARLGLVPPQTKQEMEQSYEVKRSERKKRKKKGRGRPSKRSRKETSGHTESENGRSSNDAENLGGPITRQKQQLLEQGLLKQDKEGKPEENGELDKELPVRIKKEAVEEVSPSYPFGIQENRHKTNEPGQYHPSPPITSESLASRPPPRLTLQSLTNMEDPFNNYNTPTFRPPYLRHTGLLSVSQESNHHGGVPLSQPLRPEPIRSTGMSLSEQETRDYLAHRTSDRHFSLLPGQQGGSFDKMIPIHLRPEVDAEKKDLSTRAPPLGRKEHEYRWPGVESVMKAYFLHSGERDHELSFLQDNANKLKSQHSSLNEEANNLNTQMTNLVQTKKHLHDEKKACRENLDRLHYFMQSFQR